MLSSTELQFSYRKGQELLFPKISASPSEPLLISGNSGCGKTTWMSLLTGLLSPKTGRVEINGTDIFSLSARDRDAFRAQHIGLIFQKPYFIPSLSAEKNVGLIKRFSQKDTLSENEVMTAVGLGEKLNYSPVEMSLGELQRLTIARAIIHQPKLIIADEPTSSLDDNNCENILQLLFDLNRSHNTTLVVVSHDHRLDNHFSNHIKL